MVVREHLQHGGPILQDVQSAVRIKRTDADLHQHPRKNLVIARDVPRVLQLRVKSSERVFETTHTPGQEGVEQGLLNVEVHV